MLFDITVTFDGDYGYTYVSEKFIKPRKYKLNNNKVKVVECIELTNSTKRITKIAQRHGVVLIKRKLFRRLKHIRTIRSTSELRSMIDYNYNNPYQ